MPRGEPERGLEALLTASSGDGSAATVLADPSETGAKMTEKVGTTPSGEHRAGHLEQDGTS
jgi:hypothetical protein